MCENLPLTAEHSIIQNVNNCDITSLYFHTELQSVTSVHWIAIGLIFFTLLSKSLDSVGFFNVLKEVSFAQWGYIYLIKTKVTTVPQWNKSTI